KVIHSGSSAYEKLLHGLASWKAAVIVVFIAGLASTYWVYQKVPSSFLPVEDQGYFIGLVQAPPGSSLEYTEHALDKASEIVSRNPDVQGVFSIAGFSGGAGGTTPNQGVIFASLKNIQDRHGAQHSAAAVVDRLRGPLFGVSEAVVFLVLPPPIQGLGQY